VEQTCYNTFRRDKHENAMSGWRRLPATLQMCTGAGETALLQQFVGMLAWGGETRERILICVCAWSSGWYSVVLTLWRPERVCK